MMHSIDHFASLHNLSFCFEITADLGGIIQVEGSLGEGENLRQTVGEFEHNFATEQEIIEVELHCEADQIENLGALDRVKRHIAVAAAHQIYGVLLVGEHQWLKDHTGAERSNQAGQVQLARPVLRTNVHEAVVYFIAENLVHVRLAFKDSNLPVNLDELIGQQHHEAVKAGCS
jgi:hypothetical protein